MFGPKLGVASLRTDWSLSYCLCCGAFVENHQNQTLSDRVRFILWGKIPGNFIWNWTVTLELVHLICSNMDEPRDCYTEWSKSDTGEIPYDIPCMWNLKRNDTNELTKQKESHRLREGTYGCRREIVKEFGTVIYTLLYLKWMTNKDLLYSTWSSAQCYMPAWMGGEFGREWMHAYVWLSSFAVPLKLSQHCELAIPQYNIKS